MNQCPFKPLLDFDTFAEGTPCAYIDELRGEHRHARPFFMDGFEELRLGWDRRSV